MILRQVEARTLTTLQILRRAPPSASAVAQTLHNRIQLHCAAVRSAAAAKEEPSRQVSATLASRHGLTALLHDLARTRAAYDARSDKHIGEIQQLAILTEAVAVAEECAQSAADEYRRVAIASAEQRDRASAVDRKLRLGWRAPRESAALSPPAGGGGKQAQRDGRGGEPPNMLELWASAMVSSLNDELERTQRRRAQLQGSAHTQRWRSRPAQMLCFAVELNTKELLSSLRVVCMRAPVDHSEGELGVEYVVVDVVEGSQAAQSGVRSGDVIQNWKVATALLAGAGFEDQHLLFRIMRRGGGQ